jgi:hypothetical protein
MRLRLCQLFLLLFLFVVPARADEVVVTFDAHSQTGTPLFPASYTENGITFCCNVRLDFNGVTRDYSITNNSNHITAPRTYSITYENGAVFDFLGVQVENATGRDVFRASNGVEITFDPSMDLATLFRGITWLEWVHYGFGGEPGPAPSTFDNFRFNTHPETIGMPEPATLLLLGSGLLGVFGARRVKKGQRT